MRTPPIVPNELELNLNRSPSSRFTNTKDVSCTFFSLQHFKDIFGDQLYGRQADGPLLSPNELKRRFLISTKSIKETEEGVKGAKKRPSNLPSVTEAVVNEDEDTGKQRSLSRRSCNRSNGESQP